MSYFIGLDVGTTGAKAVLMDVEGLVQASETSSYDFQTPKPLWAETDPEAWWTGSCNAIKGVINSAGISADQIKGIGDKSKEELLKKFGSIQRIRKADFDEISEVVGKKRARIIKDYFQG